MMENYESDEFWAAAIQIPDKFKIALADFIINFERIEAAMDQLIWWSAHIDDPYTGRVLIARLDIRPKCEMALKILDGLSSKKPYKAFKRLNKNIEALTKSRNTIVHGWWVVFGDTAAAMSTRFTGEPGAVMGGSPFTLPELIENAATAKTVERAILDLIREPAPSRDGRGC